MEFGGYFKGPEYGGLGKALKWNVGGWGRFPGSSNFLKMRKSRMSSGDWGSFGEHAGGPRSFPGILESGNFEKGLMISEYLDDLGGLEKYSDIP